MPRLKPTEELDTVGHLDRSSHKYVAEYLISKQQDNYFRKPPNENGFEDSIETFYSECLKEYNRSTQMHAESIAKNEHYAKYNLIRERLVCKDHVALRMRFIEVSRRLKSLSVKRENAIKSLELEYEEQKVLMNQIETNQQDLVVLTAFLEKLKKTTLKYICYEEMLESFIKKYPRFPTVDDFITRTDALMLSSIEIDKANRELSHKLEALRSEIVGLTRHIAATTMSMKNELDFFARAYVKVRNLVNDWEEVFDKGKIYCRSRELDKNRMYDGLYNLYLLLCRRKKVKPTINYAGIEQICDFIKEEFDTINGVVRILEKRKQRVAKQMH